MEEIVFYRKTIQEQADEVLSAMRPGQEFTVPIRDAGIWSQHISKVHARDTGRLFKVVTRRSVCPEGKAIVRRLY